MIPLGLPMKRKAVLPFNGQGMMALLKLLQVNLPLYDDYIYYNGELVNSWKEFSRTHNRNGDDSGDEGGETDGVSANYCGTSPFGGSWQSSDRTGREWRTDQ